MRGPITACLLHADFHVMTPACWTETLLWRGAHEGLPDDEQRWGYQAAVERAMLDAIRSEQEKATRGDVTTAA